MAEPLVSVICACFNQSKFCIESLESVKNQTYKNIEIIIWDDASVDNSVEKIEDWIHQNSELNIRFIKNKTNLGICISLNNAYSFASGKYLQLLALDDILLADKIERHVAVLENSSIDDALVFTDAYLIDDESVHYQNRFIAYHKHYLNIKSGNFFEDLLIKNYIPAMSVFYKMSIFDKVGLWDERLDFEDYDMLLRIAKDYSFIFDDKITVKYRLHENNTHKKLSSGEITKSMFLMYLKFINYNVKINHFLKDYIITKYRKGELTGEQSEFFIIFPPKNYQERWLSQNKNIDLYNLVVKLSLIKNCLLKLYIK